MSEPLRPGRGSGLAIASGPGEPAVPEQFTWRGEEWVLQAVLRKWKTSGPCRHGSGEKYLRRHYYQVRVARAPGEYVPAVGSDRPAGPGGALVLTIYFERQPRRGQAATARWYVYTLDRVIGVDAG